MSSKKKKVTVQQDKYHKVSIEYKGDEVWFKGDVVGVKLVKRDENDNHIVYVMLSEDDGFWNEGMSANGLSTYFLSDQFAVMNCVTQWLSANCDADREGGWKFR